MGNPPAMDGNNSKLFYLPTTNRKQIGTIAILLIAINYPKIFVKSITYT